MPRSPRQISLRPRSTRSARSSASRAMMATFVLVHGGGHGGWCWRACANELRSRGHEVYAPTLTGFGERAHLPAPDFETFVTGIANVIALEDLVDVVVVGLRMGGVIIPRV